MASTSRAHPSIQRINQAYVQVPASPLSLASYHPLRTPVHTASSTKLKENTPFRLFTSNASTSRKRKLSDCISVHDGPISVLKKAKFNAADETPSKVKAPRSQQIVPTANACPDFPNGYVYCHQCSRKRDILATMQCNTVKQQQTKHKGIVERHCTSKYCKACLKRRYNEEQGCASGVVSFFKCPRCRGVCNCAKCRKVVGDAETSLPGPHSIVPGAAKSEKNPQVQNSTKTKAKDVVIPPPKKVLPQLKWTPVPCVTSKVQVEERIFIREFALRFSHVMEPIIAKSNLEELEFIGGKTKNNDDDEMLTWVSEPCLKGLLLGLLGLLAKDHESDVAKEIKTAIKIMRSAGVNLNKLWLNLLVLRTNVSNLFSSDASTSDTLPSVWVPLTFPDPLPAPQSAMQNMRSLRNVRTVEDVNVVHTAQMIPVLISLIHSVLETANIREEIDQGIRDARDIARDAKEAIKIENERWEKEKEKEQKGIEDVSKTKVDKNEDKAKRKAHKDRILDINNVVKLTAHGFTLRFSILGMDHDGRTYYALSPGVLEREVGFEYLEMVSTDKQRKSKKKGRILADEDRNKMKEWSWFVSVWGKKPPFEGRSNAQPAKSDTINSDEEDGEEEEVEKWWGFWEPEEIVKVADWIYIKSKLEDQEVEAGGSENDTLSQTKKDPAKVQLKHLVTQLKDYAALLEWRTNENKFSDAFILEQTSSDKGKERLLPGTVSADAFYGKQ